MREIPSLQVLCLRSVGGCSAEVTFAKSQSGEPSTASRLLRSFHSRPVVGGQQQPEASSVKTSSNKNKNSASSSSSSICSIPMERTPCIGDGSARRMQANEVDLNHPMIGCRKKQADGNNDSHPPIATLYMQHGNPALDCLQSYIDSLVELGRMDGARLGVHFFEEWRMNVMIPAGVVSVTTTTTTKPKKRRRSSDNSPVNSNSTNNINNANNGGSGDANNNNKALGSLSLHNCTVSTDTIEAMAETDMGPYIGVLDLTGIHGLTDSMLAQILPKCPNLYRLSIKNCRRITGKSLLLAAKHQAKSLTCLDVGGSFNITKDDLLDAIPHLTFLDEIHASGLDWTDATMDKLVDLRDWKALSFAYSSEHLTQVSLRTSLVKIANSIISIAMPFCEFVVDNALLGMMGRNLPLVRFLDVRGNASLSTLTGWYDGRTSANLPPQRLLVLGRYSGLSESNVEETKRVHPLEAADLTVILDGTGTGTGITISSRNR